MIETSASNNSVPAKLATDSSALTGKQLRDIGVGIVGAMEYARDRKQYSSKQVLGAALYWIGASFAESGAILDPQEPISSLGPLIQGYADALQQMNKEGKSDA